MARLEVQRRLLAPADIVLRSPPNWTVIAFFAGLAGLHVFIAATALFHQRWEGFLSVIFGLTFAGVAVASSRITSELAILPQDRRVRLRTGTRRIYSERFVPFTCVQLVRLTLLNPRSPQSARIEIVCDREVLDCPPTSVPREEALCLAMTMQVRLVKVYGEGYGAGVAERLDRLNLN